MYQNFIIKVARSFHILLMRYLISIILLAEPAISKGLFIIFI
jgi:hypothetical protein